MPSLLDRAIEADTVWATEIKALADQPFASVYASLYASLSMTAHGSVTAVDRFVVGEAPRLLVGFVAPLGRRTGIYDVSCSLLAIVLVIASRRLGWRHEAEVWDAAVGQPHKGVVEVERAMRQVSTDEPDRMQARP